MLEATFAKIPTIKGDIPSAYAYNAAPVDVLPHPVGSTTDPGAGGR